MSWIFQKKGIINHYKPLMFNGTQPVRVLHPMINFMFQHTNPLFFDELKKEIENGKVNKQLILRYGRDPIRMDNGRYRTPRIDGDTKSIELHETFLSFLWCSIYATYVTYLETIDFPRVNKVNNQILHPITPENIDKAKEMFDYAKSLIAVFNDWDKDELPNPEIYLAENRTYIEQTNLSYTEAVKFILCHEYTHLKSEHVDQINENTTYSHYLIFEFEADNNAIDIMKKGFLPETHVAAEGQKLAVEIGIILGIVSMFYFSATTEGVKHPNAEDRLTNALERLILNDNHVSWGMACVGLKFWDEQFGLNLEWEGNPVSHKNLYYNIVNQIKNQ